jgi:hypothetical protein
MFTPKFTTTTLELLLKIDSIMEPGVPEDQFLQLFAVCHACGNYMTRRTTLFHDCAVDPRIATRIVSLVDQSDPEV